MTSDHLASAGVAHSSVRCRTPPLRLAYACVTHVVHTRTASFTALRIKDLSVERSLSVRHHHGSRVCLTARICHTEFTSTS